MFEFLLIIFIFSLLASLVLLIWIKFGSKEVTNVELQARNGLLKSVLIAAAGSGGTLFSYWFATRNGNDTFVVYGGLIFGIFYFVKNLVAYFARGKRGKFEEKQEEINTLATEVQSGAEHSFDVKYKKGKFNFDRRVPATITVKPQSREISVQYDVGNNTFPIASMKSIQKNRKVLYIHTDSFLQFNFKSMSDINNFLDVLRVL
jgi:hypothetical protein